MTAGIMELCTFASLQDYNSLQKVPRLMKSEKLRTSQCDCEYFGAIAGVVFKITNEKLEIFNYHYCTSLRGNCLEDLSATSSMDIASTYSPYHYPVFIIRNKFIISVICHCLLLSEFMRPLRF